MRIAADSTKGIIWLSSYPKSGNTWLRFLLLNLVYGRQESSQNLDRLTPDIHKGPVQLPQPGQPKLFVKSHLKMSETMPLLEHTAGFIYVVRNPVDVLLSNLRYYYWRKCVSDDPEIRARLRTEYIAEYIAQRGDPRWQNMGMGSWDEHVTGWLTNSRGFPGFLIRYEDLLTDPLPVMRNLCAFLGLGKTTEEIRDAVHNSSFDRIRAIEEREIRNGIEGFFFSSSRMRRVIAGNRFMQSGRTGAGIEYLDRSQIDAIVNMFRPIMEKLGYSANGEGNIVTNAMPFPEKKQAPGTC